MNWRTTASWKRSSRQGRGEPFLFGARAGVGRVGFWLAVAAAAGCAPTARYVLVEPGGGTVAIFRNSPEHRQPALALAAQACPGGYDIVREEEVVTGETVIKDRSTEYDRLRDQARTTEEHRSRRTTEWRITYRCR